MFRILLQELINITGYRLPTKHVLIICNYFTGKEKTNMVMFTNLHVLIRFASYNHVNTFQVLQLDTYTDEVYQKHFSSTRNWTREETDHLFDLVQRFDLRCLLLILALWFYFRWIIIHDRYDKVKYKPRTIEDLKERYYTIANHLRLQKVFPILRLVFLFRIRVFVAVIMMQNTNGSESDN